MIYGRARRISVLIGCALFFAVFAALGNSNLADAFRARLIFREVTIPVYQWCVALLYIVFLKLVLGQTWKSAISQGVVMTMVAHLYPAMLDTQKQVWHGTRLSAVYVIYINSVVGIVTASLIAWSARVISAIMYPGRAVSGPFTSDIFLPVPFFAAYGILFYAINGLGWAAVIFALEYVSIILATIFLKKDAISATAKTVGNIFKASATNRNVVLLIFVLALVIRLIFLFNLLRIEGPRYPLASDDGTSYDAYAMRGLQDPMFYLRESPHKYLLFYSVPLAIVYKIFGHSYLAAGAIQSIIGALMCCMVFMIAKKITGSTAVSLLASAGAAIDSELIFLAVTLNTEALYIPLLVAVTYLLIMYSEANSERKASLYLAGAAISLGLATIIRVPGILLLGTILPWMLIWGRRHAAATISKRMRDSAIFLLVAFLPVMPITITNYINTHKLCLVYATGSELWAVGSSTWGEAMVPSNRELIGLGMTDPVKDILGSVKAVAARPGAILAAYGRIVPKRMYNLFLWPNFGLFDPIYLMNPSQGPNRYASNLEFYALVIFFLSFPVFIFSYLQARLKAAAFFVIGLYAVFHGIFFLSIGPRYGAPMRPFLCIIMSFCVYRVAALIYSGLRSASPAGERIE